MPAVRDSVEPKAKKARKQQAGNLSGCLQQQTDMTGYRAMMNRITSACDEDEAIAKRICILLDEKKLQSGIAKKAKSLVRRLPNGANQLSILHVDRLREFASIMLPSKFHQVLVILFRRNISCT